MVAVPTAAAVAKPPGEVMVATPVGVDVAVQVAVAVTSSVVLSLKFSVAVNCWVEPLGRLGVGGVTVMETGTAGLAVRFVLPIVAPTVAVMLVTPVEPLIVARPPETIVATAVEVEPQVAEAVRFWVLPSV